MIVVIGIGLIIAGFANLKENTVIGALMCIIGTVCMNVASLMY